MKYRNILLTAALLAGVIPVVGAPLLQLPASASSFGMLGGSVSNTGTSTVAGNVGATSTITGFPPGTATGFVCTPTSGAPCTGGNDTAVTTAYNAVFGAGGVFPTGMGLLATGSFTTSTNQTFLANKVYSSAGSISTVSGTNLVFDAQGDSTAEFVVVIPGAFTVNGALTFSLQNGARAANIFWVVQNAVTISVGSSGPITFDGNVLSGASFTMSAAEGGSGVLAGMLNGCVFSTTADTLAGTTIVTGCAPSLGSSSPEPGSWCLLGAGLAGLIGVRRRVGQTSSRRA